MVAARGGTSALYWLGCQKEVAWERVKGRNGNSTDLYIAPETFESLWPQIEPPGQDEDHIVISS
jgi:gluconate kinase